MSLTQPDQRTANALRGEATLAISGRSYLLRPTFEALVAAEEELGSLLTLVETASQGALSLAQMSCLAWHCLPSQGRPDRSRVGDALLEMGLIEATKPVRMILSQILKGSG